MVEKNQEIKYKAEINKSKNPAIMIFTLIVITFIFGIGITIKSCKTETVKHRTITSTSPNTDRVSKMEKKLGPGWKKIEMIQNKWYGPYPIKNGTKWRIAIGGITVKVNRKDNETYQEFPNSKIELNYGKKVEFSSLRKRTVMFFKY